MKDFIIYKDLEGNYITLPEYVEAAKKAAGEDVPDEKAENADAANADAANADAAAETAGDEKSAADGDNAEKPKTTVYYVTDEKQQSQYINMFKENGKDAVLLTHNIDQPFISQLEYELKNVRFMRIDAEVAGDFKDEVSADELKEQTDKLTEMFRKTLNKDKLEVKVEKIKSEKIAAMITLSEEKRRMQDMMRMYSMNGMNMGGDDLFAGGETLVLNANHPLVKYLFEHSRTKNANIICAQLYDLATLAHKPLDPAEMTAFVERSNEIMLLLTK